jgi:hypothetical protein
LPLTDVDDRPTSEGCIAVRSSDTDDAHLVISWSVGNDVPDARVDSTAAKV